LPGVRCQLPQQVKVCGGGAISSPESST
jgi:hypothetical protein